MKHKHYDMIVAKAANMDLVVFLKNNQGWSEKENQSDIQLHEQFDYFLCLPKHKKACLHWLNGGEVEYRSNRDGRWYPNCVSPLLDDDFIWSSSTMFISDLDAIRIKPKKEKRWIAVNPDGYVMPIHTDSIESARAHACHDTTRLTLGVQFIEIEFEV